MAAANSETKYQNVETNAFYKRARLGKYIISCSCLVYLVHNTETVNEPEILRYEKENEKIIIEVAGDKRSPQS